MSRMDDSVTEDTLLPALVEAGITPPPVQNAPAVPEKELRKEAKAKAQKVRKKLGKDSALLKDKDTEDFEEKLIEKQVEKAKAGEAEELTFDEIEEVANDTDVPKTPTDDEVRHSSTLSDNLPQCFWRLPFTDSHCTARLTSTEVGSHRS
jgi:hypothetical protein